MCSATQRCIFRVVLAVLWLGAVHHCALEGLIRSLAEGTAHHAAGSGGEGCSSHTAGDPASHEEGSPCIASFTLSDAAVDLAAPPLALFADLVRRFRLPDPSVRPDRHSSRLADSEKEIRGSPVTTLSHSLSLAPNAPPRVA
jgi:hypothetical protein